MVFRICKGFRPHFFVLRVTLHTGLTAFLYDHDINIIYLEEDKSKVSLRPSTTPCLSKSSRVLEPVCLFYNKKEKNPKVDGSRSAAVKNLMLK